MTRCARWVRAGALALVGAAAGCWMKPVKLTDISRSATQRAEAARAKPPTWRVQETHYPGSDALLERRAGYSRAGGGFVRHGLQAAWYADGTPRWEKRYSHGERDGIWRAWAPGGAPEYERAFTLGEPSGAWRTWYAGGAPRSEIELGTPDAPRESLSARWWHPNGQLSSAGTVQRGVRHGPWLLWREDGTLAARGGYAGGERVGVWELFHVDGSLAERGPYHGNARVGTWEFWEPGERWPEAADPGADPGADHPVDLAGEDAPDREP